MMVFFFCSFYYPLGSPLVPDLEDEDMVELKVRISLIFRNISHFFVGPNLEVSQRGRGKSPKG